MLVTRRVVFPDGRQFVQLTADRGQWRDINGIHLSYVVVEQVTYASTLGEQFLIQRGIAA